MTLNTSTHNTILIAILKEIYGDTTIASALGFKGGTAAYLFYNFERFSVDLDFDLLDETKEDYIFERVEQIVKKYGTIKEARKKRFNLFFLISYEDKAHNIKVEINRRRFGSNYEVASYLGISMLVMTKTDMFANKLIAMADRIGKANRDIFDVWFFLTKNWPINKTLIEKRVEMPFKIFLEKCIHLLEKLNDNAILSGMGELLSEKQKVWVKANLKKDTIFWLKVMLSNHKKENLI